MTTSLTWLRDAGASFGADEETARSGWTVRNAAKVLTEIYRYARSIGLLPHDKRLPTERRRIKAELSGSVDREAEARRGWCASFVR